MQLWIEDSSSELWTVSSPRSPSVLRCCWIFQVERIAVKAACKPRFDLVEFVYRISRAGLGDIDVYRLTLRLCDCFDWCSTGLGA